MSETWRRRFLYFAGAWNILALFSSGGGNTVLLVSGVLDAIFAGLFVRVLWLGRTSQPAVGRP